MTTQPITPKTASAERKIDVLSIAGRYGALIFLVVLCIVFSVLEPAFLNTRNIFNVIRQVSIYGLLAIGMTFVILTGGIDLSIGSVLALAGLVCAAVEKGGTGLLGTGAGEAHGYRPACSSRRSRPGRPGRRPPARPRCQPPQSPAFHRDARRHVRISRACARVLERPADQCVQAGVQVVGPGHDRSGARAGHPVLGVCDPGLHRIEVHEVRPLHLRGRRQFGGGPPVGLERQYADPQRVRHHGLLRRAVWLRSFVAAQFCRAGCGRRLRAHR